MLAECRTSDPIFAINPPPALTWLLERKSELVSLMGAETKVGGEAESQGRREGRHERSLT